MYKFCTMLFALALTTTGCSANRFNHDPWLGHDKAMHFTASAAISFVATSVALDNGASDGDAFATGMGSVIAAGCAKEYFDVAVKDTFWSWKDMTWNTAGGLAGGYGAVAADE